MENPSTLNVLLQRIDQLKAEVDALHPLSPEQEGRIVQKFRLDWNYHSNAIEGNSLTYGETVAFLMEGLTAKGKPFKDHLDIKGHNEGIDYLFHLIKNREQLTEKIIRELHAMILVEPYSNPAQTPSGQLVEKRVTLGAYKILPNHVKTPTGEIHYYATPEETPAKMTEIVDWLRENQQKNDLHPLLLAAAFHYRFVAIHPFDDGNGRMSRMIMNLLLMQYGYPPVVIKQQDRQAYYYALRQADAGDLSTFIEYIGENLLHSLNIQLKGAKGESMEEPDDLDKEIALLKGSLGDMTEIIGRNEDIVSFLTSEWSGLLNQTRLYCHKIDDLFANKRETLVFSSDGRSGNVVEIHDKTDGDWVNRLFEPYKQTIILKELRYEYRWISFKTLSQSFDLEMKLIFRLHEFTYEVDYQGYHEKRSISKPYSQKLTPEEITDLSKIFVREALEQIKARTGKSV